MDYQYDYYEINKATYKQFQVKGDITPTYPSIGVGLRRSLHYSVSRTKCVLRSV
jgi:hypothetical protein